MARRRDGAAASRGNRGASPASLVGLARLRGLRRASPASLESRSGSARLAAHSGHEPPRFGFCLPMLPLECRAFPFLWRGGRAAEGTRLEIACTGNGTEGSNPSLSASGLRPLARRRDGDALGCGRRGASPAGLIGLARLRRLRLVSPVWLGSGSELTRHRDHPGLVAAALRSVPRYLPAPRSER